MSVFEQLLLTIHSDFSSSVIGPSKLLRAQTLQESYHSASFYDSRLRFGIVNWLIFQCPELLGENFMTALIII